MTPEYMLKRLMNHVGPYIDRHAGQEYAKLDSRHQAILHAVAFLLSELHRDVAAVKRDATRFDTE